MNEVAPSLASLLEYAKGFETAVILHSDGFADPHGKFELLAGFSNDPIPENTSFPHGEGLWLGFLAYDLKQELHGLSGRHPALVPVPDQFWFQPQQWIRLDRDGNCTHNLSNPVLETPRREPVYSGNIQWNCRTSLSQYLSDVESIRQQIINGDFYEMNHCIEWVASGAAEFNPVQAAIRLAETAPAPFGAFVKLGNRFLISASPERFLRRNGDILLSEPIKGTRKRLADPIADGLLKQELQQNEKDRSENIMITDLVRNDLSIVCQPGSVVVPELCSIRSFSHVHQMVSVVQGHLHTGMDFSEIIRATFPMGSMTGAPKNMVMQETERYENFKRGWYSGSVGWYEGGEFDLSVVIRSLQYDADTGKLGYHVGGAIVFDSDAAAEYEECAVKAAGILSALQKP